MSCIVCLLSLVYLEKTSFVCHLRIVQEELTADYPLDYLAVDQGVLILECQCSLLTVETVSVYAGGCDAVEPAVDNMPSSVGVPGPFERVPITGILSMSDGWYCNR